MSKMIEKEYENSHLQSGYWLAAPEEAPLPPKDADLDFNFLDHESRKWFLKNISTNDAIAWNQDYKRRFNSGRLF